MTDQLSLPGNVLPRDSETVPIYAAHRVSAPIDIDGNLNKPEWQSASHSSRFVDLISGASTIHDTRTAVLWNEQFLYVAYWMEEPIVEAKFTERDSLIYEDNDVELFIAGDDGYYEFEINAFGTI